MNARNIGESTNKNISSKMAVLIVEPHKQPRVVEIAHSLKAMQELVGGYIQIYKPFDDECAIICNDEGKLLGLPLNRAIYSKPEVVELTYQEMKNTFRQAEKEGKHIKGYVVFTEDSFEQPYPEESRTYVISSDNKAFIECCGGYSIFASCADGSDPNVRLDWYMAAEHGGKDGWKIERCYMQEDSKREIVDIIAGTFFVCYAPVGSEELQSLPSNLVKKYEKIFKTPEVFLRDESGNITVMPLFSKKTNDKKE